MSVPESAVGWPLSREQRELLTELAMMIRRFGTERFLSRPLVRADARDFPGAWEPTLTAVHALLYRLCWLAYVDPEIVVEDRRAAAAPDHKMLTRSEIELATVAAGVVTLHVAAIGNDDVAGLLSHKLGQAFLELAPGDPFRTVAGEEATEVAGSVAAIYLGLGVLVANSAMYRRAASRIAGRSVVSEEYIEKVGGLHIVDATLLVAVQDVLRDDYQEALTTLHKPQQDWVEQWRAVLEPHEDELRELLELEPDDARDPIELVRPAAPRKAPAIAEPDLRKFNHGEITFRVKQRKAMPMVLGVIAGATGFALPHGLALGPALMLGCGLIGRRVAGSYYLCTDIRCGKHMETELPVCPRCGGTIAETLEHVSQRLDRLDALERERDSES